MSDRLSVCLSVCLSLSLSLSVYLYLCPYLCLSILSNSVYVFPARSLPLSLSLSFSIPLSLSPRLLLPHVSFPLSFFASGFQFFLLLVITFLLALLLLRAEGPGGVVRLCQLNSQRKGRNDRYLVLNICTGAWSNNKTWTWFWGFTGRGVIYCCKFPED